MFRVFLPVFIILFSISLSQSETGSCPPTLPVNVGDATCGPTTPCTEPQICCPTERGGSMCVDPMTTRHFVNLVKPGNCPAYPGGVWQCSHTCTTDSDCPRALKCCANRCGALICQKPSFDEENTVPPSQ